MAGIIREQIFMVNSSDRWNKSPAGNAYLLHLGQKLRSLVYSRCLNFKWLKVKIFIKSIPVKFQAFHWRRFQLAFLCNVYMHLSIKLVHLLQFHCALPCDILCVL